jgi:disulfide bond formation protein DsbB
LFRGWFITHKIGAASNKVRRAFEEAFGFLGHSMEVFAVTIFMSLAFAVLFAVLFFAERTQRQRRSLEQMSLLPLESDASDR